jgi:UDP-N-acetylglucosamine 2-epimerase
MIVLGTRPEAIKLAPLILEMQSEQSRQRPLVCVTGQHRQMLDQVLDWFGIACDYDLNLMQANQSLAEFASRALTGISRLLEKTKPDAVIVQGDTTTAMAGALAAFYHRVPVGHVEAGLRTRDRYNPFPEEINRRIAGTIATLHFAPTQRAADALISEQVDSTTVHVVGNTVVDALRLTMARPVELKVDFGSNGRRLILVTAHRRESFGSPFDSICMAIRTLAERNEDIEFVYPVHLNPNVRDPVGRHLSGHPRIHLIEPLRYEQFVHLMSRADLILTDSGGIQEEATVLRKPTLVMRDNTERPEAISSGTAMLVGSCRANIIEATERLLNDEGAYRAMSNGECPFGDGYSARRILEIMEARSEAGSNDFHAKAAGL